MNGSPVKPAESPQSHKLLEEIAKEIADEEALVELFEQRSKLERRKRKYKQSDPAETWASRWVALPIASLFPADRREEWLGDLYELNREMLHKNYPRWSVSAINVGKTVVLIFSALQIKLSDFFSPQAKKTK
ncbi:MAG: hypothetical protein AAF889_11795 [Cyanobacteria bacterium P01_D01_bin.73]